MPRKPGEHRTVTMHVPLKQYEELEREARRQNSRLATVSLIALGFYLTTQAEKRRAERAERAAQRAALATTTTPKGTT